MPGKSRHGKGKHYNYSKKSKAMRRQAGPAVTAATVNTSQVAGQPALAPAAPLPKAAAVAPAARVAGNPYPYISSELRRIAVLAGIIVVILVVLSIVLK